jgi:hypothetical protein
VRAQVRRRQQEEQQRRLQQLQLHQLDLNQAYTSLEVGSCTHINWLAAPRLLASNG